MPFGAWVVSRTARSAKLPRVAPGPGRLAAGRIESLPGAGGGEMKEGTRARGVAATNRGGRAVGGRRIPSHANATAIREAKAPGTSPAPAPAPAGHFRVAVPTGVAFVAVKVYQGRDAHRVVAGPNETLQPVSRTLVLVLAYSEPDRKPV